MLTTDGKELIRNLYYHTRTGQEGFLDDWAKGQSGSIYIVSRFYEGLTNL